MCTVRLRCKNKTARCRFFVVPRDSPALIQMQDIEVIDILKIMCKVMGEPHKSGIFDDQTMQTSNNHSCKANKVQQIKADSANVNDGNSNMPDYFRSRINKAADKRACQVLMSKIHNGFSGIFFHKLDVLKVFLVYRLRMTPGLPDAPRKVAYASRNP